MEIVKEISINTLTHTLSNKKGKNLFIEQKQLLTNRQELNNTTKKSKQKKGYALTSLSKNIYVFLKNNTFLDIML